jgi:hypothetical protein
MVFLKVVALAVKMVETKVVQLEEMLVVLMVVHLVYQ